MQLDFVKDLVSCLEKLGIVYAITGSVASNVWGTPRTTHDVDVVVVLSLDDVSRIVAAFGDRYYVSEAAVRDAIVRESMFNVVNTSTGFKADLWVTTHDPFNQALLNRRQRFEVGPGLVAYLASPEDVLLHKLAWNLITPSERQLMDVAGIAQVQAGQLDLAYLRSWAAKQATSDTLEAILQGRYLKQT